MTTVYATTLETPEGTLRAELAADGAVQRLAFADAGDPERLPAAVRRSATLLRRELDAYFKGRLRRFTVPVGLHGTPFQQRVWRAVRAIPYGSVVTYAALARAAGNPVAVRAVGRANAQNPLCLLVPDHRVVGADGRMTGYGPGGVERKLRLLRLEGVAIGAGDRVILQRACAPSRSAARSRGSKSRRPEAADGARRAPRARR